MARDIKKRPLREADAEEFVVRIDLKGPDGVTYDQISYIDGETDILEFIQLFTCLMACRLFPFLNYDK